MKKSLLVILSGLALVLSLGSCGTPAMTAEEIAAEVEKQFAEQEEKLSASAEEACNNRFDELVQTKMDSILVAAEELESEGE